VVLTEWSADWTTGWPAVWTTGTGTTTGVGVGDRDKWNLIKLANKQYTKNAAQYPDVKQIASEVTDTRWSMFMNQKPWVKRQCRVGSPFFVKGVQR
jgi:hypothetical protein